MLGRVEQWELVARERIRDTVALYNWAGDGLRLDDLASVFVDDGVLEVRGREPIVGRAAIVEFFGGVAGGSGVTIVRHNVTNLRFLEVSPTEARVACYFTVLTDIGLDHHGRYRDRFVPVGDEWRIAHRFVSTDWRATGSMMA